ncbi:piggyBac transposable element-derived protein 3-like, partial [Ostrinia furnacalis]|uniref:piggyBac transposable element-derived protein 3-like n=1 Tax=Ostrinia furnacalis TaxID=93504 RepID=UPI00103C9437
MDGSRKRGLRDDEIQALMDDGTLENSEFEDEGEADTDFARKHGDNAVNSSSSDSSVDDETPLSEFRSTRNGPRTRGGISSRLGRYVDDDLIQTIVAKSNQTHLKKFGTNLHLIESELYVYLGITMIMASLNYPRIRMYWETKYRVPMIADSMPRNRFLQLRNSLKFVYDDDVSREDRAKDKLWKIRPLLDKVVNGCRKQVKQKCLSIDEMIVPFTGQCGIKQYVPGKPNPTGLKAFVLANPNGIVCNFKIYQGQTTYPNYDDTDFGLGMKAVLDLAENLAPGHILYFDRYFTTVKLTEELLSKNLLCAGTIMKNRIPLDARNKLKEDRQMKTEGRGTTQVLVNRKRDLALTKWYDNKGVTLLSTIHAAEPMDTCRRWCKAQKTYVEVQRPTVVKAYNTNMGGVDLADRLLSVCPNRYRTVKWTQRVFNHMIDLALSNSWLVYKSHRVAQRVPTRQILQLRDFKLDVGESLIEAFTVTDIDTDGHSEDEDQEQTR